MLFYLTGKTKEETTEENFSCLSLLQIKGLETGFLPRTLHVRGDWVPVSGRRGPGSS